MKKVLLFSAAILALSSCSNTDVLEEGNIQQTNAIGFQTLVNKGVTCVDQCVIWKILGLWYLS